MCAIFIFNFQHTPETLSLIFCTLMFHFQKKGCGRLFIVSLFFAHTLALQVFKLGVWDENLVLHPKLNAQRGSPLFRVAGVALGASTFVLRGRCGTWVGSGGAVGRG